MELLTPKGCFEQGNNCLGGRINFDDMWLTEYSPGNMLWASPLGVEERDL